MKTERAGDCVQWTDVLIAAVNARWNAKLPNGDNMHSTADIAKLHHMSKNALVGKIRRLQKDNPATWPPRENPVRKRDLTDAEKCSFSTLWNLGFAINIIAKKFSIGASSVAIVAASLFLDPREPNQRPDRLRKPRSVFRAQPDVSAPIRVSAEVPHARTSNKTCQWLTGNRPYVACDDLALMGKPYCEAHSKRAYVAKSPASEQGAHLPAEQARIFGG